MNVIIFIVLKTPLFIGSKLFKAGKKESKLGNISTEKF